MVDEFRPSRRTVVQSVAAVGVAVPALAGCGGDDDGGGASGDQDVATIRCGCHGSRYSAVDGSVVNGPAPDPLAKKKASVSGDGLSVDGAALGATADIPVGGGKIFNDQKVVVTQPEAGQFKAFSAVCTHQGCIVSSVEPA